MDQRVQPGFRNVQYQIADSIKWRFPEMAVPLNLNRILHYTASILGTCSSVEVQRSSCHSCFQKSEHAVILTKNIPE